MINLNQPLVQMQKIAPNRQCVNFLINRIQSDSYRQIHISQHNRYTQDEVFIILQEIYKLVGLEAMQIRTTDLNKRPQNIAGEEIYATITSKINVILGRCTQDSLRKNFFVDFHRMGFLYRYNTHKQPVSPFQRAHIKFIKLTPMAEDFLNANSLQQKQIYAQALYCLMKEFIDSLYCIVYNLSVISKDEFMLFATFVNESIDEIVYGINEIIELVKDFRTLNISQKKELIDCIHTYCNPANFSGNKRNMRDFPNWLNETQQIWYHLPFTGKFMVENYILRTI